MSKYTPAAIEAADLEAALAPAIGGEAKVFISEDPFQVVADVRQPAIASGVMTLNTAFSLPAGGKDLALVVDRSGARSAVEMSVTLNVVFDDDSTGTVVATFDVPDRAPSQRYSFPQGAAVDFIGQGGGANKKVKTVSSLQAVVGGAVNNRFEVIALPELESYVLVGCTNQANFRLPVGNSLPIPCGLNPSRFTKRGRGEPGTLNVIEKYSDYLLGLTRTNGLFVTGMVEIQKDERILTDRFVVGSWRPMASPEIGDGEDIATANGEGNFSAFAIFTAR